jgi:uncharacterized RDD family membrane protein YckC
MTNKIRLQNQKTKPNLSSRKRGIVAFIIDHFALTFLIVSMAFLALGTDFLNVPNFSKITATMIAIILLGLLLYFGKDSIKGISIGKWIMGIMVRDKDNPELVPSFGKLLFRNIFLIIWPVEFIVLAASEEKKRLGDKLAKTIVVKNPNKPSKTPRIITLASVGIILISFLILFTGSAMKRSDAYKVAIENIEQNQSILKETGGITGYGMMPTRSIKINNGFGQAELEIKVLGTNKALNISVYLTKEPNGKWELIELNK